MPNVKLISFTPDAADLLIFTKSTRLNLSPTLLEEIKKWPERQKIKEIEYIANTIPSSWEFVDYTFLITGVSRAFTHQFVRTRNGSYAQQTMRMLDMSEGFEYIKSRKIAEDPFASNIVDGIIGSIATAYQNLIDLGHAPEDARGILPTNISTNIVAKFNLRTFSDLVKTRSGNRVQEEYREIIRLMVNEVMSVHPFAATFLYPRGRSYFDEIETFADERLEAQDRSDLSKIVHKMRSDPK